MQLTLEEKEKHFRQDKPRQWFESRDINLQEMLDFLPGEEVHPAQAGQSEAETSGERIYRQARADLAAKGKKGKLKVVFFPYKAALWDSMETIYEAAIRDKQADVRVVPIPWEQPGSGEEHLLHDEMADFSQGIRLFPWRKYNLQNRRPDIVFVHNPYDQFNSVVRIAPEFFIKNMRPYVRELVYVPYYVSINGWLAEDRLMSAGLDFADLVPLESEAVRQKYMQAYRNFGEENDIWKQMEPGLAKFKVLGSPKFDRVRRQRAEDREIPADWKPVLHRQGGGRKRVVLYNTSLQAFYDSKEKMLDKIERVLECFKARCNEICLLWRPHPLYREMLADALPQGLGRYEAMVRECREGGWGIYDDLPNMYRSIALSDAYYGDMSSVITLYRETGKPILIQHVDVK